ncbi:aspartate carbamoyltransferase [Butyricicoccus sp. Marseille-Q5471]|uniref:aspartate carbamoyltransferase n=1 Tax=Butyricicoccus sp. Marseille-Q5471 TaxID=3039493 RepID=UPI0024BC9EC1|nr:aspartate carbamoyltransferase [Butyricicoccus sp. Marseille-Q5471]
MRHIIDLADLTAAEFSDLYKLTTNIIDRPEGYVDACRGKVLGSLFYEPSTRTNLSFSTAMMRLGGSVVGFSDPNSSSTAKGETLKDTISMVSSYADLIVMRNPREGAAKAASLYSSVPVINAGDGGHLHPTQTLTDMVTILRMRGSADNMKIGLCGDLKYGRTVHSLLHFLERYHNVQIYLIAPDALKLPDYMVHFLKEHQMPFCEVSALDEVLPELDVLYMTRIQRERFVSAQEYENLEGNYQLTAAKMKRAKKDMLVLHPLPRVDEIAQDVDDDPRAVYFKQARYGMFGRMALLLTLSKLNFQRPAKHGIGTDGVRCSNPKCITKTEPYLPLDVPVGARCPYCDALIELRL